jgi:ubiquinone/menaquinone biosynthesis C-methylase UbiE
VYASDWARFLVGNSFHPGGLALTEKLGYLLKLRPGQRLLDVASGNGTSAVFLAQRFGCEVVGVDFSQALVARATAAAKDAGLANRVQFKSCDAEDLPFPDDFFDALICECAFCTFPDKVKAASEFVRVLRSKGRLGLSDLTRSGRLPEDLEGFMAWVACIGDARPLDRYLLYLEGAGLTIEAVEIHYNALSELVQDIRARLTGAQLLGKINRFELPESILNQAQRMAGLASIEVREGRLGYALVIGIK